VTRDTLFRVALVLLVVTSLGAPIASVATAQEMNDSESDELNESGGPVELEPPGSENDSDNESSDGFGAGAEATDEDEDDDDEGRMGGLMPSVGNPMPSGYEVLEDMLMGILEDLQEGIASGIDMMHFVLVGMPAPGEATDPSTWIPPENGAWPYVFAVFGASSAISTILLVFATQFALSMDDIKRQRKMLRQIGKAFAAGPILGFPLLALSLHLGNAFAMGLSPSGEEFLMDYGSVAELGFGFIIGALTVKFKLIIIFIGLVILIMIYFSILFLASVWPLLWAMQVTPIPTLQSWGTLGLITFGKLVILRVTQAFILRFTFEMPWGSIGDGSFFLAVLGMAVGLLIALVGLPWIVLRKVTIASAVGLGMAGVSMDAINNAPSRIRSGASRVRSRMKDARSTSKPSRTTGQVKSKAYSGSSQSKAAPSSRTVGSFGSSGRSRSSMPRRSRSSQFQSRRNASRAAKSRGD
jgi:hypothetical protein